ncbi:dethiobiotin synthetase [Gammaproteobacteria bacterium]
MKRDEKVKPGYFITATDTGCGKTLTALTLMQCFKHQGLRVLGMKPVAAGCISTSIGPRNDDALRLCAMGSLEVPYEWVNPFAFLLPIAPHLAAADAGIRIDLETILHHRDRLAALSDILVVEGAGGLLVPLGEGRTLADLAIALGYPLILVVGLRLGCLNHAQLTEEAIQRRGMALAGWIGNRIDPGFSHPTENLDTLAKALEAPCLGVFPWQSHPDPDALSAYLNPFLWVKLFAEIT